MTEEQNTCDQRNFNMRLPPFLIGVMIFVVDNFDYVYFYTNYVL